MDVSTQLIVIAVLLSYGELTTQATVDKLNVILVPPNEDAAPALKNCTTGLGTPGNCVDRAYCDYGTPAIDFTLYATRGYQTLCSKKEVCCPFSYQLPVTTKKKPVDNEDFNFDSDDD